MSDWAVSQACFTPHPPLVMYKCIIFEYYNVSLSLLCLSVRNETRSVIRVKVLNILSFVLSTNRQLYEVLGKKTLPSLSCSVTVPDLLSMEAILCYLIPWVVLCCVLIFLCFVVGGADRGGGATTAGADCRGPGPVCA